MTQTLTPFSTPFADLVPGTPFVTEERVLTQADVDAFAALTGDRHPQHVDPAWATASPFGQTIAHGLLVLSAAAGLVPFDPERVVALRRVADVVFKRPVVPGEAIRVEGEIEALREPSIVVCRWKVVGPQGTCLRARVEVVWR